MSLRPCLHSTGQIWDRFEIRPFQPCKHTRTTEPDEFETPYQDEFACKQAKKDEFQTGPKFVRNFSIKVKMEKLCIFVQNITVNDKTEKHFTHFMHSWVK
jgi:hypothetical protein